LFSSDVFVAGESGYHSYRIPVLLQAADGTLLAFCEARKFNMGDPGTPDNQIDLVVKRSFDHGRTWSEMQFVEKSQPFWSAANPAAVLDRETGRIWLHYLRCQPGRGSHTGRPGTTDVANLLTYSDDHGRTWAQPQDITACCRKMEDASWRCTVTGPGGAIQDSAGNLLVPCWKYEPFEVFVLFSQDHGKSWQTGSFVPGSVNGNEGQLVELNDGRILFDFRQEGCDHRGVAISEDGGRTWSKATAGQEVTPVCCGLEAVERGSERLIVWSGPKGPGRNNLVIRLSPDDGQSYTHEYLIAMEAAAYSSLEAMGSWSAGILWERANCQYLTFTFWVV